MLTLVGLGLYDEKDISMRGYQAVRSADMVFAEFYTSRLIGTELHSMEEFFGKRITVLSREDVENGEMLIEAARDKSVVLLVAGDPLTATTHISLRIMAQERGVETRIIHGASISTAGPGLLGLQHYKFGRVVSIPYPQDNYFPTSAYDFIYSNYKLGLHTLILLDINPEPMTANQAMQILLEMEKIKRKNLIKSRSLIGVVARAGSPNPTVRAGYLGDLIDEDFGSPLHTLVFIGKLHFAEAEALVKLAHAPPEILQG